MLFQILLNRVVGTSKTVPDPDLEMGGGGWGGGGGGVGGGSSRSLYKEGGGLQKNFFWPLGPHFGLIIRGGGGRSLPWIRHLKIQRAHVRSERQKES